MSQAEKQPGSDPGLRLQFQEWVDHGYPLSKELREPIGPCPICGSEDQTCKEGHQNG